MANLYRALLNQSDTNSRFVKMDRHAQCQFCSTIVSDVNQCQTHERQVQMHTLHDGSIPITVIDVVCPERE